MSYIERRLRVVYLRVCCSTQLDQQGLPLFRIFFGLFNLYYIQKFSWIGEVPGSFYSPPIWSVANLFHSFPSAWVCKFFDFSLIVLLFCIIAGIKARLSCILTFVLLIVAQSFHFSFGKIDHATLLTLTYLALACTNSGCEYTLIKDKELSKRYQNIGIAIFSICIAFGLFTAGFPKLISWVDFDLSTNGILSWYYQGFYSLERQRFLAPFVPHVPMILMEMGDYFAVFLELSGFFFLIKGKTYWRVWLLVLSFFHLMNVLILNIPFLGHIVVYGLFVLPPFFRSIIVDRKMASSIWLAGVVAGTVLAGFRLYEQWFNLKFEPFFGAEIASIFLWAGMFVITGMVIWQERPTRAQDMQMQGIYHGEKS